MKQLSSISDQEPEVYLFDIKAPSFPPPPFQLIPNKRTTMRTHIKLLRWARLQDREEGQNKN